MSKPAKRAPLIKFDPGMPLIVFLLVIFVGDAIALALGSAFFFYYADSYRQIAWVAFFVLMPLITAVVLARRGGHPLRSYLTLSRFPQLIFSGFGSAFLALAIVFSPYGWVVLLNEAWGDTTIEKAKVQAVWDRVVKRNQTCARDAVILARSREVRICLADHYHGNEDVGGAVMLLTVRHSALGYRIGELTLDR